MAPVQCDTSILLIHKKKQKTCVCALTVQCLVAHLQSCNFIPFKTWEISKAIDAALVCFYKVDGVVRFG